MLANVFHMSAYKTTTNKLSKGLPFLEKPAFYPFY